MDGVLTGRKVERVARLIVLRQGTAGKYLNSRHSRGEGREKRRRKAAGEGVQTELPLTITNISSARVT